MEKRRTSIHRSSEINRTKTPMSRARPCVISIDDGNFQRDTSVCEIRIMPHCLPTPDPERERCESKDATRFLSSGSNRRFTIGRFDPDPNRRGIVGVARTTNASAYTRTRNFRNAKMMQALTSTNLVSAKTVKVAAKKRGLVVMNSSSGPKRVRRDDARLLLKRERGCDAKCARESRVPRWFIESRLVVKGHERTRPTVSRLKGNSTESRTRTTDGAPTTTPSRVGNKCGEMFPWRYRRASGRRDVARRVRGRSRPRLGRGVSRSGDRAIRSIREGQTEATTMCARRRENAVTDE